MQIEIVEEGSGSYDDLPFPEAVYKIRTWNDQYEKRVLTHREVFYASPSKFKDPLDCKNRICWDILTDQEILNKYFQDSHKVQPNLTWDQRMIYAIEWANKGILRDKNYMEKQQQQTFEMMDQLLGVLSLTIDVSEIKIWEEYAAHHTGFGIELDPKIMFRGKGKGGGIVLYPKELPQIHPINHSYQQQSILQSQFKLEKWNFESEYRSTMFKGKPLMNEERRMVVPVEAFRSIILGALMPTDVEGEFINSIPPELKEIPLKKAVIEKGMILFSA